MTSDVSRMKIEAQKTTVRMVLHGCFSMLSSFIFPHSSFADSDVIARIGNIEITTSDLQNTGALDAASLRKVTEAMLVQRMVLKEALEKNWDQKPETQRLIQNTREAAITDSYLKKLCEPPASFPDENQLKAAYEAAKPTLKVSCSFRLSQIFVSENRLAAVKERLKANPTAFGQIAREMSEHEASAKRDGELGWLTEAQIQPEILAQLPKLTLGMISEPLKLGDGWHILKVLDVREAHTPYLEQVREPLTRQLRAEKTRANLQDYMAKLLQQHPVSIDELALSRLVPKTKP